ncbi:MAG TPA: YfiR family protein [Chitinophagales bacterium]|nr:YfiR family protein [Chitinophagales bacterium]
MKAKWIIPFLLLFFVQGTSMSPIAESNEEYNLKAAFVYRFTNYIDWETHLGNEDFVIGIVGASPISQPLYAIAKSQTVKGHKIIIRTFNTPADIGRCHLLFIPQRTGFSLSEIMGRVPKGMLTVSEKPGYAAQGTNINFVVVDDKLKFEINTKSLYTSGLTASSQILKLAIIVN